MGDQGTIEWTRDKLRAFKAQYVLACHEGKPQFTFDGFTFLTEYAKYLLQYLEEKFK